MTVVRQLNRAADSMRPTTLDLGPLPHAEGSCIIRQGGTHVLCAASICDNPPGHARLAGHGWITAEYALLPRSTHTRTPRERQGAKGRTQEIQRLIGRALRATANLHKMPNVQITVDCDVLQADGGTRCASITGASVAVWLAIQHGLKKGMILENPWLGHVAAISVGIVDGVPLLDLDYPEDSRAGADANLVMTAAGETIEFQATAERSPLKRSDLDALLRLGEQACQSLLAIQDSALNG